MSPNEHRKIRFIKAITLVGIPIALMFAGLYAYMEQREGFYFGLAIALLLCASRLGINKGVHRLTYLLGTGVLTILFLLILATGTGAPHNIFWFFLLPMVFYILLDMKTATLFLGLTTAGLFLLLVMPDIYDTHVYDNHLVLRFFIVYALVSTMAWAYEATRKGYETDLFRQNEEIVKQKEFLSILLETLPNPFFFKDVNGRYQGCNRAFEAMLRTPREEIIGRTVYEIAPKEVADIYHEKDRALINAPGKQVYESRVIIPDRGERNVIFHKSTFADNAGEVQGIMGVVFDITDLKNAEAAKTTLIHELETALAQIQTLGGMLPICSSCKKIRDDQGYWQALETYIETHSDALFSHSM
ncbi:MAG: PAS domain-containing protein, partial [Desulfobacterales bacterium]|nr:PAS domain-containing protein [Desulfobacterales bacterium]